MSSEDTQQRAIRTGPQLGQPVLWARGNELVVWRNCHAVYVLQKSQKQRAKQFKSAFAVREPGIAGYKTGEHLSTKNMLSHQVELHLVMTSLSHLRMKGFRTGDQGCFCFRSERLWDIPHFYCAVLAAGHYKAFFQPERREKRSTPSIRKQNSGFHRTEKRPCPQSESTQSLCCDIKQSMSAFESCLSS